MLDPQMKRGLLENCILSVLCRGDSYGYKIIQDLAGCISVSESTLYPILRRLESGGALTVYSVEHNGRLRKFYRITPAGRTQLNDFLQDWAEISALYAFIREGIQDDKARVS